MTLSDLASFVCNKVRQTDTQAVAHCKEFLRQRYELIYNNALWRDSLWEFQFTFTPDTLTKPESYEGGYFLPTVVDKLLALRRSDGEVFVVAPETLVRSNLDQWAETGDPVQFHALSPCVRWLPAGYPYHDLRIYAGSGDAGLAYVAHTIDSNGDRQRLPGTLASGDTLISSDVRIVERVTKPTTAEAVLLFTNDGDTELASAAASATSFTQRPLIRLLPEPTAAVTLRALVKKKVNPLAEDGDVPELRDIDNCLLAFAHGDMLERGRQYGKAQIIFQEAGGLLNSLKAELTWQDATRLRMMPDVETVSGDVDYGVSGKGYW